MIGETEPAAFRIESVPGLHGPLSHPGGLCFVRDLIVSL